MLRISNRSNISLKLSSQNFWQTKNSIPNKAKSAISLSFHGSGAFILETDEIKFIIQLVI